jgi:hypothetical protein
MVKNKRYLVTDYLKINAPIRGEINEKILGRRFEIGEKNNKKKMAVPLQRKCTCLNEPVIGLEEFDKRFDSESENRMTSTMTSASFADK